MKESQGQEKNSTNGSLIEIFSGSDQVLAILQKYSEQPPEVFHEKGGLKNFPKFTGKHLCQGLFLNNVTGVAGTDCFPVNFTKFSKTPPGDCF